jgi:hypothetical protein
VLAFRSRLPLCSSRGTILLRYAPSPCPSPARGEGTPIHSARYLRHTQHLGSFRLLSFYSLFIQPGGRTPSLHSVPITTTRNFGIPLFPLYHFVTCLMSGL